MYLCQVVVEVHISGTQVATQQCSMGGENSCNRKLSLSAQHQAQTCQPLMELGYNVWRILRLSRILQYQETQLEWHASVQLSSRWVMHKCMYIYRWVEKPKIRKK